MRDSDKEVTDLSLFDTTEMKMQSWPSKDRLVHTIRLSDTQPINELKVYLFLKERIRLMEIMLGIEGDEPHLRQ